MNSNANGGLITDYYNRRSNDTTIGSQNHLKKGIPAEFAMCNESSFNEDWTAVEAAVEKIRPILEQFVGMDIDTEIHALMSWRPEYSEISIQVLLTQYILTKLFEMNKEDALPFHPKASVHPYDTNYSLEEIAIGAMNAINFLNKYVGK
jgi:hypothetical protein